MANKVTLVIQITDIDNFERTIYLEKKLRHFRFRGYVVVFITHSAIYSDCYQIYLCMSNLLQMDERKNYVRPPMICPKYESLFCTILTYFYMYIQMMLNI